MHILITNDDGPPSDQSSPYVHSLVSTLQKHGHTVSVVLPHTQRSWIGKAHLVGKSIKPTYFRPAPLQTTSEGRLTNHGTTHNSPLPPHSTDEEWVLVDSTPASCVQIGLYHYFLSRGPIDLVVSGPNYGRNSTAVFSLSSGTIGGAMEAAVCGVKSIALSYAFFDRNHDATIISDASELSAKLIQYLYDNWDSNTHLYTVNVPLVEKVGDRKILWTNMLQNKWRSGSCFQVVEVPSEADDTPSDIESQIRKQEEKFGKKELRDNSQVLKDGGASGTETPTDQPHMRYTHKHFKWAPSFKDVYESVEEAEPGNDGWAVAQGYTSVTPLRANFWHVGGFEGEIKL
ncbi:tubulin-tyrosine ligase family protein [Setomelanomma holmii]|uniref:Tubulin-tyrosine ligase family protein n=1 Tax=Setomelanomma holmii TaxID=210430 RepID=A0A9P4H7R0_9PLEO|nr:tubulin-tyrosine ligase family protein [Setomelanomma holmii]